MLVIEKVKEIEARYYYIHRTAEEHLSVEQLKKIINANDFENRATMPNNFPKTISNSSLARKAVMMFKDEYLLAFRNRKFPDFQHDLRYSLAIVLIVRTPEIFYFKQFLHLFLNYGRYSIGSQ